MAHELETIKGEVSEMKTMVKDIHTLLAGNPIDPAAGGLLNDIRVIRKEMDEVREQIRFYKAFLYAIATLIGLGAVKVVVEFLTA